MALLSILRLTSGVSSWRVSDCGAVTNSCGCGQHVLHGQITYGTQRMFSTSVWVTQNTSYLGNGLAPSYNSMAAAS